MDPSRHSLHFCPKMIWQCPVGPMIWGEISILQPTKASTDSFLRVGAGLHKWGIRTPGVELHRVNRHIFIEHSFYSNICWKKITAKTLFFYFLFLFFQCWVLNSGIFEC
jgi:hypothetical protein